MSNLTVKNGLKNQIAPNEIFSQKTTNDNYRPISPFHSVKFRRNPYSQSRVMKIWHFQAQTICPEQKILNTNHYYYFHLLVSHFHCAKIKNLCKNFPPQIQSYEDAPFLGPKWSICLKQIFFWIKLLISFSSTYWPLSLCKILQKFVQWIQSYEDAPF